MQNIRFGRLFGGTAIDNLVDALTAGMTDAVIDIHIERGIVDVKARPSGYVATTRSAMEAFEEKIAREGVKAFDHKVTGDYPEMGCMCAGCVATRDERGF